MRVGVLTGGGDCPGLNAVIRAVVRKGEGIYGDELVGFRHGWRGVLEDETMELTSRTTRGLLHRGGTILGTSRTQSVQDPEDGAARVLDTLRARAHRRADRHRRRGHARRRAASSSSRRRARSWACPRRSTTTSSATDVTFGFHTAVQIATDAIDRLHTTAESHDRVMVVEVMGRHAGWIATYSGIAGGADIVLVPEQPFDIDEVCERIEHRHRRGASFSIVVVAEGADADGGHDDAAERRRRRVRPRAPRRDQHVIRRGDRAAHRLRDPGHGARARAARRHAHRVRPRARDPVRHRRDRRRARRRRSARWSRCAASTSSGYRSTTRCATLKTVDPELLETASVFFG